MATVIPDISPGELLKRFRGHIFSARPGYPDVLLLKLRDAGGDEWWFSTFYAEFSPSDPSWFMGKTVVAADVDPSGTLKVGFSDGSDLEVRPAPLDPDEPGDDLETWHLITPEDLALNYGPRGIWRLKRADEVV
jgi:hypothetical protein